MNEQTESTGLLAVINKATIDPNVDVAKLERMYELYERHCLREAEQAYNEAMRAAQEEMPRIIKGKKNDQIGSMYADLGEINEKITPIYTKHGFSLSFGTSEPTHESDIRITCEVRHNSGHKESFYFDLPLDNAGIKGTVNKTTVHASGSTTSYGQRYLIKMIFNLTIDDEDDDAQASGQAEHDRNLIFSGELKGIAYMKACYKHKDVIEEMKDRLADNDYLAAAEAYMSLTNPEQTSIKRAPTKGGIFTIDEVKQLSSDEFKEAMKEGIKANPDVDRSI